MAATANRSGSVATCAVKPEMTQGPYFVDEKLDRGDIRSDSTSRQPKPGAPLALTFNVSRIQNGACTALPGAQVDVWHCDVLGVYSDASDPGFNTRGQTWLRGYQVTKRDGAATFMTILPGWYRGRATHIHFKIRGKDTAGSPFDFTSQIFFDEQFLSAAYKLPPYNSRSDSGRTLNASDRIYSRGGSELLVTPASANGRYSATFNIGLNV